MIEHSALLTGPRWSGRQHTEETKKTIGEKNSISQQGSKNSQFGTSWIHKDKEVKKVKKDDLQQYLLDGWNLGRVDKPSKNNVSVD